MRGQARPFIFVFFIFTPATEKWWVRLGGLVVDMMIFGLPFTIVLLLGIFMAILFMFMIIIFLPHLHYLLRIT